ncbi:MAG: EAL domain-containing protein [Firmicutes bacterium]|nr:EAL domain-containing protein [Bacillota bacterium]
MATVQGFWSGEVSSYTQRRIDIERILSMRTVDTFFQPIVDLQQMQIIGWEALSRGPAGTPYERPDWLLQEAERVGLADEMDWLFFTSALDHALAAQLHGYISVNIRPPSFDSVVSYLYRSDLLDRFGAAKLILEVTESAPVVHPEHMREAFQPLRERGAFLALDDVGAGHSNLYILAVLKPDFIKLDRRLVDGVAENPSLAALVMAVAQWAAKEGIGVIAEGVERPADLVALRKMPVHCVQGFLLGRPRRHQESV